jgi:hypothetical protein
MGTVNRSKFLFFADSSALQRRRTELPRLHRRLDRFIAPLQLTELSPLSWMSLKFCFIASPDNEASHREKTVVHGVDGGELGAAEHPSEAEDGAQLLLRSTRELEPRKVSL